MTLRLRRGDRYSSFSWPVLGGEENEATNASAALLSLGAAPSTKRLLHRRVELKCSAAFFEASRDGLGRELGFRHGQCGSQFTVSKQDQRPARSHLDSAKFRAVFGQDRFVVGANRIHLAKLRANGLGVDTVFTVHNCPSEAWPAHSPRLEAAKTVTRALLVRLI